MLEQFAPTFYVGADECDVLPSSFERGSVEAIPTEQDGTIYGQVSLYVLNPTLLEIHYHHLWRNDCGSKPHPLDAEHVSGLIDRVTGRALYWFAAAHQDTLCDASQGARAESIEAVTRGPRVWISEGKHASYLSDAACVAGCGEDRCTRPVELARGRIVNLGETGALLNGSDWAASEAWPLMAKMDTDFPAERLALLDAGTGVVSLSTAPRGMRRTIATSNATAGALALGGRQTNSALEQGFAGAGRAIEESGRAIQKAHRATVGWLRTLLSH